METTANSSSSPSSAMRVHQRRRRITLGTVLRILILVAFTLFIMLPIVYMATTSIKEPIEIRESGALLPTRGIYIINWIRAYSNVPLGRYLFNSTVVAVSSVLITLSIATPVTYSIVRFKTGGKVLPALVLGMYVMPPVVVSIAIFAMIRALGLIDQLFGLIIVHGIINLPVAVWLLDSFMRAIPVELEQAAWLDGYSRFDTLRRVVLPLIKSGLVATGIICLILSWNEFLFALILTYSDSSHTFPIGISRYEGEHGLQFGEMSAAALTGIVPIYILVLFFQRYLVEGLTHGGVKG
jgi:multiple sugar transport system permease protein